MGLGPIEKNVILSVNNVIVYVAGQSSVICISHETLGHFLFH